MNQRATGKPDRERGRKRSGVVVEFPIAQMQQASGSQDAAETSSGHRILTEALRAKDERLSELVRDRERFIHDLQDGVLQSLYAVRMDIETVDETRGQQSMRTSRPLRRVIKQITALIQDVRAKIFALESATTTGFELERELRRLVTVCGDLGSTGMTLSVDPDIAGVLTREESYHLLHIAQAVVFDSTRRHEADRFSISLRQVQSQVCFKLMEHRARFVRVTSFDQGPRLQHILDQVHRIGGRLTIRSKPTLSVSVWLNFGRECLPAPHSSVDQPSASHRTASENPALDSRPSCIHDHDSAKGGPPT